MARKQSRNFYSGGKYGSKYQTTVKMGKKFRTRAGRYGCYVYVNGIRSHFEADNESRKMRFEQRPAKHWPRRK
jgi:hypothetical protein